MLECIRAASQGLVGRAIMTVLLGLIVVSFAVWGIGDVFRGFGTNKVASVGRATIAPDQFRAAYQTAMQRYQRQTKISADQRAGACDRPRRADARASHRRNGARRRGKFAGSGDIGRDDRRRAAQRPEPEGLDRRVQPRSLRSGVARHRAERARLLRRTAQDLSAPADRRIARRRPGGAESAGRSARPL